ncbi:MAG: hypothetical protein ACYSUQ_12485 [Planctomycetota bacterium]
MLKRHLFSGPEAKRFVPVLALGAALAIGVACSDDEGGGGTGPVGPFQLTFELDDSFQGPHGGQAITVAVVRASNGAVVERGNGTVSATASPPFSFTTGDVLEGGTAYEVHYWIDSNFGGGIVGVCDPKATDHQWNAAVAAPSDDVTITEAHDQASTEDVCTSFTVDLDFALDATFQAAHGGQEVYAAVVTALDGAVIARRSGTVSMTADPSFSFSIPRALTIGTAYQVRYWIDSNFGGGTAGACDPKANDHQWSAAVAAPSDDVSITDDHDPATTVDVCESFAANLTFSGDASFQGPHGDQDITVMVVRASDDLMVGTETATISATADPAFSFSFPGLLVIGEEYNVEYWIDSNFGGGTIGQCDVPSVDHQWRTAVPAVTGDTDITDAHDAGAITDVCGAPALVSFVNEVQPIFSNSCAFSGCHGGASPAMGMNLTAGQAYANIVDVASVQLPSMDRIEPGMPDLSYLIHKIQGTQASVGGSGLQMPRGGTPLPQATIDLMRLWVTQGARDN